MIGPGSTHFLHLFDFPVLEEKFLLVREKHSSLLWNGRASGLLRQEPDRVLDGSLMPAFARSFAASIKAKDFWDLPRPWTTSGCSPGVPPAKEQVAVSLLDRLGRLLRYLLEDALTRACCCRSRQPRPRAPRRAPGSRRSPSAGAAIGMQHAHAPAGRT